ncbi:MULTISPECIES: tyrosine-type recombinase/integrase [Bacteroidaceae]|jgi:integrase|nr:MULTISPECIES: site-specific integrase [Bacteroidaceae]MCQ1541279.1 site-specific integrase [Bacteroides caccae]UVP22113.1 site-specific integrase [Bacteroides xylanisolvens]UYV00895.1 site-specific integrase [Bacteroides thetaiotaomicron]
MKRKKYMLDSIDKISVRKKRATELIANISRQLLSGWNPWADTSNSRQYTLFDDVVELYNKYLIKFHKSKVFKESTFADYKKRIRVLSEYNKKRFNPIIYIYQFDKTYASDFLDYILIDRDSSARTRNNYRTWLSSFGSWLLEKQYIDKNPVENIKSLSEDKKKRDALSANDLQKLRTYLEKNNPYFLLLCQFAYYTLIRPDELSNIQLSDIYIKDQKVFIPSSISKNRKDGMVGLNDILIKSMLELKIFNYSNDCYLFGKDFKPSKEKSTPRTYRTYFNKVRTLLKFPDSYQFYSLKDTGIRDLANSAGIVIARDQARHSDISTTNKYLKGEALPVHEETKHFEGLF